MDEEKDKRKKSRVKFVLVVVFFTILLGAWWAHSLQTALRSENAKVVGNLVNVSPSVSGKVEQLHVAEGQEVTKGYVLAELDDAQFLINLQIAQAALDLARANYNKLPDDVKSANSGVEKSLANIQADEARFQSAQAVLADARRQLEENKLLYSSGAISKETFDLMQSNYMKAQAGLDAASANVRASNASMRDAQAKANALNSSAVAVYKAQLEQAEAVYNSAKLSLEHTIIKADVDGTVIRIPVDISENISSGQTVMTIVNLRETWINANIEEKNIDRIKTGQRVDVRIDAYPGKVYAGQVAEVGSATQSTFALIPSESTAGSFTKVAQRLPVKIKISNGEQYLKPGMSAVVKIYTNER